MITSPSLLPAAAPSRGARYGLMNTRGQYFCHAYRYGDTWLEWDHSAHDAHHWVDLDSCIAAARTWNLIHGEELEVVLL